MSSTVETLIKTSVPTLGELEKLTTGFLKKDSPQNSTDRKVGQEREAQNRIEKIRHTAEKAVVPAQKETVAPESIFTF